MPQPMMSREWRPRERVSPVPSYLQQSKGNDFVSENPVRVALVGIGNCAASLVQGVEYYKDAQDDQDVPGLMHVRFGDYHINDVKFVAAFDVDDKKSAKTSRKRSSPARTTPSNSPMCPTAASMSSAVPQWTVLVTTTGKPSMNQHSTQWTWSQH